MTRFLTNSAAAFAAVLIATVSLTAIVSLPSDPVFAAIATPLVA